MSLFLEPCQRELVRAFYERLKGLTPSCFMKANQCLCKRIIRMQLLGRNWEKGVDSGLIIRYGKILLSNLRPYLSVSIALSETGIMNMVRDPGENNDSILKEKGKW
jgi:hypothetical protein